MNHIIPARNEQIKNSLFTSSLGGSIYAAAAYATPYIIKGAELGMAGSAIANLASGLFQLIGGGMLAVGVSELNNQLGLTQSIRSESGRLWTEITKPRAAQSSSSTLGQYIIGALAGAGFIASRLTKLEINNSNYVIASLIGGLALKTIGDIYAAFSETPQRPVIDACPCDGICPDCKIVVGPIPPNSSTSRIGQSFAKIAVEAVAGSVVGYLASYALPISPFIGMMAGFAVAKNMGDQFYVKNREPEAPIIRPRPAAAARNPAPGAIPAGRPRRPNVPPAAPRAPAAAPVEPEEDERMMDYRNYMIGLNNRWPNAVETRCGTATFYLPNQMLADRMREFYQDSVPQVYNALLQQMVNQGIDPARLNDPQATREIRALAEQQVLNGFVEQLLGIYPNLSILDPQGRELNPQAPQPPRRAAAGRAPYQNPYYAPPRAAYRGPYPQQQYYY